MKEFFLCGKIMRFVSFISESMYTDQSYSSRDQMLRPGVYPAEVAASHGVSSIMNNNTKNIIQCKFLQNN